MTDTPCKPETLSTAAAAASGSSETKPPGTIAVSTGGNSLKELQQALAYDDTFNCIQCGYCLPVCPTYETMGKETHSPRGRINLVKMTAEGKLTDWNLLADSIDKCLGCRACETACPTGVKYGSIFESAKEAIAERKQSSAPVKAGRSMVFRGLFPNKRLLGALSSVLWLYQWSGTDKLVNRWKLTRILPRTMAAFAELLPRQTSPISRLRRPASFHPPLLGKPRLRVAFFTGCIMDAMFERINRLSMELLAAGGCEVVAIPGETCCGALHAHSGERGTSKELARRNIRAYERLVSAGPVDYIVNNAGGCGAMLSEYEHLFESEPEWKQRAARFAAVSKDISEILVLLELPFKQSEQPVETVTYQRSCHMTHVQKVTLPPLKLIRSIPGIRLEEMPDKDKCCGSAGIYNVAHFDESMDILDLKMKAVHHTAARTIVTTNPGCLLQMQLGIQREGLAKRQRAVHLVELLAEACGLEQRSV
jgi:glycolate oxidase iron-sulfur subunit